MSLVTFLSKALCNNILWRDELQGELITPVSRCAVVMFPYFNSSHHNVLISCELGADVMSDEFFYKTIFTFLAAVHLYNLCPFSL